MAKLPLTDIESGSASGINQTTPEIPQLRRYAEGLPRVAADQEHCANTAIHRKFGTLLQRCLLEFQAKITGLDQDLFELDHHVVATDAQSVVSGASSNRSELADLPSQISAKVEKITSLLPSYYQLMFYEQALASLHEVRMPEYQNKWYRMKNDGYLDDQQMAYLRYPDDFVSTTSNPLWGWLYKLPRFLLVDRHTKKEKHTFYLSSDLIRAICEGVLIWFYAFILLLPVVLYVLVPELTKQVTVGILVAFTVFFAISMTFHRGIQHHHVLVGLCAYAAVLGAFLANLQGEFTSA
ncbi:hypothetical protein CSOJ01_01178 [Colletotrichum sojae]|uniref:DUF6594 domain-containing protein n=1 Tax=Colletotrichum sojae TaxID=2175907 RepID=A0A8H6JVV8_9PEZI|nr:hypothetical protein CSOJ01_01178 [Colletotrichum sojae]